MTEKQKNDVLYVCSLIETIARKTKNHRQDVIRHFTKADIERQLRLAEVNHCLSFEQVSDELIEDLNIPDGDFDTAAECRYTVPSATSIGMLYQGLVLSTMKDDDAAPVSYTHLDVYKRQPLVRSEDGFRHRAGLEQAETKQNGIAHNAPNGVDGIPGNRHALDQHCVNGNTNQNQEALKARCV